MADGTVRSSGGGGNHEELLKYFGGACFEKQRCQDTKRQNLLRFELFRKIKKILDLIKRNILISPLEGEKKFLSELNELRNFREGFNLKYSCRHSNSDLPKQLRCIPLNKFLILGRNDTVFSRFSSHLSRKRTAFTLAEVLITLGIIGIVAALTLPTLISRYQEKVFITRLEKTYSILVSAYKLAVEENGSSTAWVLVNKNMDYIRCRGELDWEEQTSCPKK